MPRSAFVVVVLAGCVRLGVIRLIFVLIVLVGVIVFSVVRIFRIVVEFGSFGLCCLVFVRPILCDLGRFGFGLFLLGRDHVQIAGFEFRDFGHVALRLDVIRRLGQFGHFGEFSLGLGKC